ncbi:MAG: biotin--[acetyl-CoA-carboxylase] ligase [Deltaproteobacteria bacterium]|nr:biotin--[acetyl-CoA-carboxylase] ligase [Deltaproteobacteria bacterium]
MNKAAFAARLAGRRLVYLAEVDSTNRYAWELAAAGAAAGTVVVAERQTGGRGRRGRQWTSAPGKNLTFSVIVRPALPADRVPLLALAAGAAGLSLLLAELPDLQVKWPNDLYCRGRKLAGILAESRLKGKKLDFAILGVGLNVNSEAVDFPPSLRATATSLCLLTGRRYDLPGLLADYLGHLDDWQAELQQHGFGGRLRSLLAAHSYLRDRQVTIEVDGRPVSGRVCGLDENGRLLLAAGDGRRLAVAAGEATVRAVA